MNTTINEDIIISPFKRAPQTRDMPNLEFFDVYVRQRWSTLRMLMFQIPRFLTLYDGKFIIKIDETRYMLLPLDDSPVVDILKEDINPDLVVERASFTRSYIGPHTPVVPPSLLKKAGTLAVAVVDWAKSGFQLASDEDYAKRKVICEACEYWDGEGFVGLGKCKACGCAGVKLKLATSSCLKGKWNAVNNS